MIIHNHSESPFMTIVRHLPFFLQPSCPSHGCLHQLKSTSQLSGPGGVTEEINGVIHNSFQLQWTWMNFQGRIMMLLPYRCKFNLCFFGGKFLSITVSTRWLWEWHRDSPGEKSGLNLSMSSSVSRELRTELEPELLRGVPLDVVLSSWARHFRPPDPGMFQVDHANYDLSKQLDYYDEFLSHDWETSRWYKLCTMMMIYNSRAAFWCTCFASIAVGILSAMKMIPNELWTQLSVLAVYPFVLCFWQRIRSIFARPMMVFLDKLCIAQHDEELKQKGIFGLAGFLDHSRQLTIFWSHRYFSRLWCLELCIAGPLSGIGINECFGQHTSMNLYIFQHLTIYTII